MSLDFGAAGCFFFLYFYTIISSPANAFLTSARSRVVGADNSNKNSNKKKIFRKDQFFIFIFLGFLIWFLSFGIRK